MGMKREEVRMVRIDPKTGQHLGPASADERLAYNNQTIQHPSGHWAFRKAVRVGDVLIDEDTGPGDWFGGAGF